MEEFRPQSRLSIVFKGKYLHKGTIIFFTHPQTHSRMCYVVLRLVSVTIEYGFIEVSTIQLKSFCSGSKVQNAQKYHM